jgi:hypothetical protein
MTGACGPYYLGGSATLYGNLTLLQHLRRQLQYADTSEALSSRTSKLVPMTSLGHEDASLHRDPTSHYFG